ncbi:MAG TPA: thioredoxin domain-containing protein [Gaiellaceae bacterium]|nr:thioredoxin domain-containing protein [Gaiellaceae bacterium]
MASKSKRRAGNRSHVQAPARRATPRGRAVVAPKRREQPPSRSSLPVSPQRLYAYALAFAALVGALLIGLSLISAHRDSTPTPASSPSTSGVLGASQTAALLGGIPQRGNVLGSPTAPVRLIEYADPQCPYCAVYARDVLPTLIRDYVRPGKVQLVFRGLWFLGRDSGIALSTATAAGQQNRFWNVMELLYRNQGPENAWVNDPLLRSIVTAAGADADRAFAARKGPAVLSKIDRWSALAQAEGVNGVPAFFYGRRGGQLNRLALTAIAVPEFRAALDGALQK